MAVSQTSVDFSQTNPAMRQQGQIVPVPVSTEMFRSRQEVYGFHCSTGLEQGLDEWVESLEYRRRQPKTLVWRLRSLEEWIPQRETDLARRQERMSLVQAGALKATTCSFGRTLSRDRGRYRGISYSVLQRQNTAFIRRSTESLNDTCRYLFVLRSYQSRENRKCA